MKLSTRLLFALVPLMAALILLGWLAVGAVNRLGDSSRGILADNFRSVLACQRMLDALGRVKAQEDLAESRAMMDRELRAAESNVTEPGESEALASVRKAWTAGDLRAARSSVERVLTINQDAMMHRDAAAQVAVRKTRNLLVILSAAALALGLLGSAWFTRRLWRPLESLILAAHRIGEGDLEMRAAVVGDDEVSELALEFNRMAEKLAEYRRSTTGQMVQAQRAAQAAIDSIPYPVLVLGADRALLAVNEAGRGLSNIVDAELRASVDRVRDHVLAGRGPYVPRGFEEAVRMSAAPEDRWLLPRAKPVYGEDGRVVGVTLVLQDVTRLRRFDELKNDLVATVAHEFRTPLTSLHMAIHLCLEEKAGPVTEKQLDLLHAARQDCERLQNITEDILDLARLQAGTSATAREPEDPREIAREAVDAHRGIAEEKGVALTCEVEEPLADVPADREAIQRVLTNLVSNAIRHTKSGGAVRVRVRARDAKVRFEVSDTGEGVAPEHQERIFERFYRVPGGQRSGAGLGLAIAREIVQRHGGAIGVESAVGAGSTFWFTLPEVAAR